MIGLGLVNDIDIVFLFKKVVNLGEEVYLWGLILFFYGFSFVRDYIRVVNFRFDDS